MSAQKNGDPVVMPEIATSETPPTQQMLGLPIRVVDARGKPVANAKVALAIRDARRGMAGGVTMTRRPTSGPSMSIPTRLEAP